MQRAVRATGVVAFLFFLGIGGPPIGGAGRVSFVPWKVLAPADPPAHALFTLYWIPASPDELKRSSLVTSRALAIYGTRCVAMRVVRVDDRERLERFNATSLPVAILADGEQEIARVEEDGGVLRALAVERMVRAELEARERSGERDLDEARQKLQNGDAAGAAAIYRRVLLRRCAFPRQAREAQRALNRLE